MHYHQSVKLFCDHGGEKVFSISKKAERQQEHKRVPSQVRPPVSGPWPQPNLCYRNIFRHSQDDTYRRGARSVELTWFHNCPRLESLGGAQGWPVKLSSRLAIILLNATCSPIAALVLS